MSRDVQPLLIIVPAGASPDAWHEGRDGGVTASEIHRITQGGRQTHRAILDEKLNGRAFGGNAHTRRGHVREAELLHYATYLASIVTPNTALFGHPEHPLHRCTPDGTGMDDDHGLFGVEAKSHDHQWDSDEIPADHYDQMQFGMWVLGFDWWLYVWEVMGADGEPTLAEPEHRWVPRDEARIARLAAEADAFIAWRDAGAPEHDDLPDDVDEAIAVYADAKARESAGKRDAAAVRPEIDAWLAKHPGQTVRAAGTRGGIVRTADDLLVLDEAAWKLADEAAWQRYEELGLQADDADAHARDLRLQAAALADAAIAAGHSTTETKYGNVRLDAPKGTKR